MLNWPLFYWKIITSSSVTSNLWKVQFSGKQVQIKRLVCRMFTRNCPWDPCLWEGGVKCRSGETKWTCHPIEGNSVAWQLLQPAPQRSLKLKQPIRAVLLWLCWPGLYQLTSISSWIYTTPGKQSPWPRQLCMRPFLKRGQLMGVCDRNPRLWVRRPSLRGWMLCLSMPIATALKNVIRGDCVQC